MLSSTSCGSFTALPPLCGHPLKNEGNTAASPSSNSLARRDQRWTRNIRASTWPRHRSERLCFPLEYCLRRFRPAVIGYFPAEENLGFDLVNVSTWWLLETYQHRERPTGSRGSKPAKNQRWQHVAANCTSTRHTGFTGAAVENTSRPQPSGIHNPVYFILFFFLVNLHFMHSSSHFQKTFPRWPLEAIVEGTDWARMDPFTRNQTFIIWTDHPFLMPLTATAASAWG